MSDGNAEIGSRGEPLPQPNLVLPKKSAKTIGAWMDNTLSTNSNHEDLPTARARMGLLALVTNNDTAAKAWADKIIDVHGSQTEQPKAARAIADARFIHGVVAASTSNFEEAERLFEQAAGGETTREFLGLFTDDALTTDEIDRQLTELRTLERPTPKDLFAIRLRELAKGYREHHAQTDSTPAEQINEQTGTEPLSEMERKAAELAAATRKQGMGYLHGKFPRELEEETHGHFQSIGGFQLGSELKLRTMSGFKLIPQNMLDDRTAFSWTASPYGFVQGGGATGREQREVPANRKGWVQYTYAMPVQNAYDPSNRPGIFVTLNVAVPPEIAREIDTQVAANPRFPDAYFQALYPGYVGDNVEKHISRLPMEQITFRDFRINSDATVVSLTAEPAPATISPAAAEPVPAAVDSTARIEQPRGIEDEWAAAVTDKILASRDFTGLYETAAWDRVLQTIVNLAEPGAFLRFTNDIATQYQLDTNETRQMFLDLMNFVQDESSTQLNTNDATIPVRNVVRKYLEGLPIKDEAKQQIRNIIANYGEAAQFTRENYEQNAQAAADFLLQFYIQPTETTNEVAEEHPPERETPYPIDQFIPYLQEDPNALAARLQELTDEERRVAEAALSLKVTLDQIVLDDTSVFTEIRNKFPNDISFLSKLLNQLPADFPIDSRGKLESLIKRLTIAKSQNGTGSVSSGKTTPSGLPIRPRPERSPKPESDIILADLQATIRAEGFKDFTGMKFDDETWQARKEHVANDLPTTTEEIANDPDVQLTTHIDQMRKMFLQIARTLPTTIVSPAIFKSDLQTSINTTLIGRLVALDHQREQQQLPKVEVSRGQLQNILLQVVTNTDNSEFFPTDEDAESLTTRQKNLNAITDFLLQFYIRPVETVTADALGADPEAETLSSTRVPIIPDDEE